MINRDQAARILKDYGQEHILNYFDELTDNEKQELLSQIEIIDFSVLDNLDAEKNSNTVRGKFEPLGAVTIEDIASNSDEYVRAGVEAIKKGKTAAVLLAGGQGTRLGFDKPKGMLT